MLDKLLPKFKIVEINNVASLRMGHVIAQTPAYVEGNTVGKTELIAHKAVGTDYKFVENGLIVGYSEENSLANYNATKHSQPCLVYTEELITFDLLAGLDQFANPVDAKGVSYVRALPLNVGDTFTTNNATAYIDGYASVENGVLKVATDRAADAMFITKKSTLPAGQEAVEVTYIGLPAKVSA